MIQGISMQARCDYMLGAYRRRFKIVGIRDVRNYPSNKFSLQARLLIYPMEADQHYGAGCLPSQIGAVHGGIEDAGGL